MNDITIAVQSVITIFHTVVPNVSVNAITCVLCVLSVIMIFMAMNSNVQCVITNLGLRMKNDGGKTAQYGAVFSYPNEVKPMLVKCETNCACQQNGYCIRAWQGLKCWDRTLKKQVMK
jgi:hypothetical protein